MIVIGGQQCESFDVVVDVVVVVVDLSWLARLSQRKRVVPVSAPPGFFALQISRDSIIVPSLIRFHTIFISAE